MITSPDELIALANEWGTLPFFAGEIEGFSVEENIAPDCWFSDDPEKGNGAWDWKADCIIQGDLAYGKFYKGKACFVSMRFFPDLVNVRKANEKLTEVEKNILGVLKEHHTLTTAELKKLCGYQRARRTAKKNPIEVLTEKQNKVIRPRGKRGTESFETAITHLQMNGEVLISDFTYRYNREGQNTGFGMAHYCTPDDFFGSERMAVDRGFLESSLLIYKHLTKVLPQATPEQIDAIIVGR